MDPRFRYAAGSGRRSPPLHNPARATAPVNIGSSYASVYAADPHGPSSHAHGARYDDPVTPRTQTTVEYRTAPAVPTPPQLQHKQQTAATAAQPQSSQSSQHHHHHQTHDQQQPHHHHHHQHHQSSLPPQTTTTRTYTTTKDPMGRSTSVRDSSRPHRSSITESTQKRPIIITTTTSGTAATAAAPSGTTAVSRGPPSPTRADHYRPPSAEPSRGPSMRDDSYYYSVPATSAAMRSRGARYSYAGAPMSATLDNEELHRLRERHDALLAAPRVDSFPRTRPVSAYVNIPRHGSTAVPVTGGSVASGVASATLGSGVGSAAGSASTNYGDHGYEYTKPSDLARYDLAHEQAPRRGRRDSFDRNYYRPTVSLTTDLGRPYPFDPAGRRGAGAGAAGGGPPPTTWGFDKINRGGGAVPAVSAGYDSQGTMRAPPLPATAIKATAGSGSGDQVRRSEHGGGLAPPATGGPADRRSSSRQRAASLYNNPSDDYYRGREDDLPRDRRDRDYRDRDRDREVARDKVRDRERDREWDRERERAREYYTDGSAANRAFGILVNGREHQQLRQAPASGQSGGYYDDYRATYADDGREDSRWDAVRRDRDRRDSRYDYDGRYGDIDREFVRGRTDHTERLGIESPKRKETDDDLYVHHPQEGMHHWDDNDRRERDHDRDREREWERERERERERARGTEREKERERERDHDYEYDRRSARRTGDEEVANTKKTRDKVAAGLGAAAAAVAATAATGASGTRPNETATDRREPPQRQRHGEDEPHTGHSDRDSQPRARHESDSMSQASYDSRTSAHTVPGPVPAPAPAHPVAGRDKEVRTHSADRTPSSSEDGDSDGKQSASRGRRQRTAASFVPTDTESLKALKAELVALDAKKEGAQSTDKRGSKDSGTGLTTDEVKDIPKRKMESGERGDKSGKEEPASPSILTPSSTSSSTLPSPLTVPADRIASDVTATSRGKGKGKEVYSDHVPERPLERISDEALATAPHAEELAPRHGREPSQPATKEHAVRLVSPPRDKEEKKPLKGILKAPSSKFPEEPNPVREGVAPHKDDKAKQQNVPPGARWTKISRKLVNPEALTIGKERFEVRDDFVIVLRVLSRDEIEAYTIATAQLRDKHRKEYEQSSRHQDDQQRDDSNADEERRHHRPRRDRDRERDRDDADDYYGPSGSSNKDRQRRHRRQESETYDDDATGSKQPAIEYYSSHGTHRQQYRD